MNPDLAKTLTVVALRYISLGFVCLDFVTMSNMEITVKMLCCLGQYDRVAEERCRGIEVSG